MPKITFIDFEGNRSEVDAKVGYSLMEAAVINDVDGIDADCGGACACATCHVYFGAEWSAQVGSADELELEMLEVVEEIKPTSRLSCQVKITEEMDGLEVTKSLAFRSDNGLVAFGVPR